MEIRLLGPLYVEMAGHSIAPNAAKPRQILALLALRADRPVPVPTLMEEIWGSHPPRSAQTTLQTYILTLRRCLANAVGADSPSSPKDILATTYGGYLLRIPPEQVDTQRYDQLVVGGQKALAAGNDTVAARCFESALRLWRGPALADVRIGSVLEVEVVRLKESRLGAVEGRIEAEMSLGHHRRLLAELTSLTAEYPLHEGLHAQWILALYRSGRAWQALDVFRQLRRRLVRELGVEPSPRIQRLNQAVLVSSPQLDLPNRRVLASDQLVG